MKTLILSPSADNITKLAEHLRQGGVAAIPTETVYGLAGAVTQEKALAAIFDAKERPKFDPLIVHVGDKASDLSSLESLGLVDTSTLTANTRASIETLIKKFWPGPLTLVLPKQKSVSDLATSGLETVAIRKPRHPIARTLIDAVGIPLCAPSANRFGRISPTAAKHVLTELDGRIPFVLDGGTCDVGLESTVLGVVGQQFILYRPGGVPLDALQQVLPEKILLPEIHETGATPLHAPGTMISHYAPRKPMALLAVGASIPGALPKVVGLLAFSGDAAALADEWEERLGVEVLVEVLSPKGDTAEAARALFSSMRKLDESRAELILAEPCPVQTGMGHAINDRLTRAAAPRATH